MNEEEVSMTENKTVRQFFHNCYTIPETDVDKYREEQCKVLSKEVVTIVTDTKRTHTFVGIDGFLEALASWAGKFSCEGQAIYNYVEETPEHVMIRMDSVLRVQDPSRGEFISEADQHQWSQEFFLENGIITKYISTVSYQG